MVAFNSLWVNLNSKMTGETCALFGEADLSRLLMRAVRDLKQLSDSAGVNCDKRARVSIPVQVLMWIGLLTKVKSV